MKASVVTPNYNGKEFLKTYFDSLNRNKDFVGEVILVDNGSTDESIEFIKDYSRTATPLTEWTRTNLRYVWSNRYENNFQESEQ